MLRRGLSYCSCQPNKLSCVQEDGFNRDINHLQHQLYVFFPFSTVLRQCAVSYCLNICCHLEKKNQQFEQHPLD